MYGDNPSACGAGQVRWGWWPSLVRGSVCSTSARMTMQCQPCSLPLTGWSLSHESHWEGGATMTIHWSWLTSQTLWSVSTLTHLLSSAGSRVVPMQTFYGSQQNMLNILQQQPICQSRCWVWKIYKDLHGRSSQTSKELVVMKDPSHQLVHIEEIQEEDPRSSPQHSGSVHTLPPLFHNQKGLQSHQSMSNFSRTQKPMDFVKP